MQDDKNKRYLTVTRETLQASNKKVMEMDDEPVAENDFGADERFAKIGDVGGNYD